MSSISEVQFASDETIFTVGDYPSDAYLFVNNALAFPCIINADNKRQCEISTTANRPQNITEFKFIYKWIYYMIEQTAEFVIYDVIPSCVNSIDNIDRVAINVTTFTDDKFAGYKMYLNGDSSYSVDAEQISTKLFSYVFYCKISKTDDITLFIWITQLIAITYQARNFFITLIIR